jgi:CheY-like chemotaxis protein
MKDLRGEERPPIDVLVVEDNPYLREAMVETLRQERYAALGAANGDEALELLNVRGRPRVIFLDLKMPVMDGWEFCRRVQMIPTLAEVPIAIVSAVAEPGCVPRRRSDAGVLRKPVDVDLLLKKAERYCR